MSCCALRGGAGVGGRQGPRSPQFKTRSKPRAHPGRLKRQRRPRHRRGPGPLDRGEACLNPAPLRGLNRGGVPGSGMRRSLCRPVLGAARSSPRRHAFAASRGGFCGHSCKIHPRDTRVPRYRVLLVRSRAGRSRPIQWAVFLHGMAYVQCAVGACARQPPSGLFHHLHSVRFAILLV
jgi:hypothetical protein